jgi:predicted amidohydrolase
MLATTTFLSELPGAHEVAVGPDGWRSQTVRAENAPRFWVQYPKGKPGTSEFELGLAGQGNEAVNGRWVRHQPVIAGKHYAFHAEFRCNKVPDPARSILARVLWFDNKGKQIGLDEYPLTSPTATPEGWTAVTGVYPAPPEAAKAQLELHFRWAADGRVVWRRATLTDTKPPPSRRVRLATVHHRPANTKSAEQNLGQFARLIAQAARQRADIVCLPEGITLVGTGRNFVDVAEPIPGPSTSLLGQLAKKHHLYVVAGLYERSGAVVYNTSVLMGRDGTLVGKYRKVCLPREEIDGGMTPGSEYPVFDTDFGPIGMMICWDVSYPEVARKLAERGAEVILMPIAGGSELLVRARALENQIHLVTSGYDVPSAIYDRAGEPLVTTRKDPDVLVQEVDLNARRLWYWIGDWRARISRERPPPTLSQRP